MSGQNQSPTDSTQWKLLLLSRLADFCSCFSCHLNSSIVQFGALCQNRVQNDGIITMTAKNNKSNLLINVFTTVTVAVVTNWAAYRYHESALGMLSLDICQVGASATSIFSQGQTRQALRYRIHVQHRVTPKNDENLRLTQIWDVPSSCLGSR